MKAGIGNKSRVLELAVPTGYSSKDHFDGFSEIEFEDYMIKPVDFDKLFAAIE